MQNQDAEAFYKRLREQLSADTVWPSRYMYKFIVPTDIEKIDTITKIFDNTGAVIESKKSKTSKYTSLSIVVNMKSPDDVIAKYKEVSHVKGVISL